jgi:hypothetical protein
VATRAGYCAPVTLGFAKRKAEAIAAIGTITVAALYALGFGVTLLHYSQLGITSLSLLRAQYILVGFYLVLPAAAFWAFSNVAIFLISLYEIYFQKELQKLRWVKITLSLVAGIGLLLVWSFTRDVFAEPRMMQWLDTVSSSTFLWVLGLTSFVALRLMPRPEKGSKWIAVAASGKTLLVTTLAVCVFRYVALFSTYGFPLIPQQYGGGAPAKIRLIPSQSAKDESAVIKMDTKLKDRSQTYELIFEDADTYILRDPENTTLVLRLKKTLFVGYELLDAAPPPKSRWETLTEKHKSLYPTATVSPVVTATPTAKP